MGTLACPFHSADERCRGRAAGVDAGHQSSGGGHWPTGKGRTPKQRRRALAHWERQGRCQLGHGAAVLEDGDGRPSGVQLRRHRSVEAKALEWTASGSRQMGRNRLLICQHCGGSVGQLYE
uniref:Uncharacterized protein n=1 Tax=Zea mays TaxID=4577 RepID=C4J2B5_MAIZE|nr:unknown [Zea mays]